MLATFSAGPTCWSEPPEWSAPSWCRHGSLRRFYVTSGLPEFLQPSVRSLAGER